MKEKREEEREKGKNRQGVTGDQAFSSAWVGSEKESEAYCECAAAVTCESETPVRVRHQ